MSKITGLSRVTHAKTLTKRYQSGDPPMLLALQKGSFYLQRLNPWRSRTQGHLSIRLNEVSRMYYDVCQCVKMVVMVEYPEHQEIN